ncbi:MAG: hypothetical protein Kow00133_15590 [Amphiplicatus sp.]
MKDLAERQKERGLNTILAYLEELRASRPSVALAENRSAKGAQTIAAILGAARKVFIRDGHAKLSLRKVAEEAGVALGNVTYYFPAKRDLLEAMLREALADYAEAHIRQFEAEVDSPLEILLNIVTFYVTNARESHRFFYQMWGYAGSDESARETVRNLYRSIGRFIYSMTKAANPSLTDRRIRQIVLQLFSLEEGAKLFIGLGPDDDPALRTAERDIRALAQRLLTEG